MRKLTAIPQFRVVLDTSVYISASLSTRGPSSRVWELAGERRFRVITSPYIIREIASVMRRLGNSEERAILQRIREIAHLAEIVQPNTKLQIVRDVNDNPIIECAVDGKADMIVTLDRDILALKSFDNISLLHVVDLLHILGE